MTDKNEYSSAMQTAFENAMLDTGMPLAESTRTELFDTAFDRAVQTARWYAERRDLLYRHLTLCKTKPLVEWRQYWHTTDDGAPFRQWVCMNLERASYAIPLFTVTMEDAQDMARNLRLEPITPDQMERVKAWVEESFDDWEGILETAILASKNELEV